MTSLDTVLIPAPDYCVREIDGETIFLADSGDLIHVLDQVGTFVWKEIDGRRQLADILARICAEFDVVREVAEGDLLRFVGEMTAKGLVTCRPDLP